MITLPSDLNAFLKSGGKLSYDPEDAEPGMVTLLPVGKHKTGEIFVNNGYEGDPHGDDDGCYVVTAVILVKSCEAYPPEYILLWLPDTKEYGTWDCDHSELRTFGKAKWPDIVADPLPYINAQWYPDEVAVEVVNPWNFFRFRKGQH